MIMNDLEVTLYVQARSEIDDYKASWIEYWKKLTNGMQSRSGKDICWRVDRACTNR